MLQCMHGAKTLGEKFIKILGNWVIQKTTTTTATNTALHDTFGKT